MSNRILYFGKLLFVYRIIEQTELEKEFVSETFCDALVIFLEWQKEMVLLCSKERKEIMFLETYVRNLMQK